MKVYGATMLNEMHNNSPIFPPKSLREKEKLKKIYLLQNKATRNPPFEVLERTEIANRENFFDRVQIFPNFFIQP
jgi:hypothetical protein